MSGEQKPRMSNDDLARQIRENMQRNERNERSGSRPRKRPAQSGKAAAVKVKKGMGPVKAVIITIVIILVIALGFLTFLYFRGLRNAQGKFLDNTYINDIEVSELTEPEAYKKVKSSITFPTAVTLVKPDGTKVEFPLDNLGYQDNVKTTVAQYMSQQNYYMWFTHLSGRTDYRFDPEFKYDRELLISEIRRRMLNASGSTEAQDAYIKHTSNGFEIVKEVVGDYVDESKLDKLVEYVTNELDKGSYEIDLVGLDLYQRPKVVAADLEADLEELESIEDIEITIDFGYEKTVLKGSDFKDWIKYDEKNALNGFTVDQNKVMSYVEELAAKYDTYKTTRSFTSTSRGKIKVEQGDGCYGTWLWQDKMCEKLISLIKNCDSCEIEPIYYVNPYSNYVYDVDTQYLTEKGDIGNTYCEVDLAAQHFWYYEKGKLKYETDIVSGQDTEERSTPGGIYKVWLKEKNKTLTGSLSNGQTWSTPVTYWNNISTFGIGLHDSAWRGSNFGGTIYKYNGSHGCINMPVAAAKYVYENVAIGTPVVMYW